MELYSKMYSQVKSIRRKLVHFLEDVHTHTYTHTHINVFYDYCIAKMTTAIHYSKYYARLVIKVDLISFPMTSLASYLICQ